MAEARTSSQEVALSKEFLPQLSPRPHSHQDALVPARDKLRKKTGLDSDSEHIRIFKLEFFKFELVLIFKFKEFNLRSGFHK